MDAETRTERFLDALRMHLSDSTDATEAFHIRECLTLAEDVHDLSFEPYKGHVEELRTRGGPDLSVNVYHLDMADPEACRDMFRKALRWLS